MTSTAPRCFSDWLGVQGGAPADLARLLRDGGVLRRNRGAIRAFLVERYGEGSVWVEVFDRAARAFTKRTR